MNKKHGLMNIFWRKLKQNDDTALQEILLKVLSV